MDIEKKKEIAKMINQAKVTLQGKRIEMKDAQMHLLEKLMDVEMVQDWIDKKQKELDNA